MRFQHHRRSEKHHTPTKVCGHFCSWLNVQYRVSLIKLNYPKRPDHAFFYLSVGHVGAYVLTRSKLWAWGIPNLIKNYFHIFQTFPNQSLNGFLNRCHAHLPLGLGSLPCSYPGTSCPSSSRSSRFPCRTWMLWLVIWGTTNPIIWKDVAPGSFEELQIHKSRRMSKQKLSLVLTSPQSPSCSS